MIRRKRALALAATAVLLVALLALLGWYVLRVRPQRHRVFRPAPTAAKAPAAIPPVEQWSATFEQLAPAQLAELLDQIEERHADLYARWSLGYLHARANLENNDLDDAERRLAPFLAAGHSMRELALYHQSEIEDARGRPAEASKARVELIFGWGQSVYRDQAIEEELDYRASLEDEKPLLVFAMRLYPNAETRLRRDVDARIVEAQLRGGDVERALTMGLALLRAGTTDDASDRVSRALDRPELILRMTAEQRVMMGESFRNHRHFDRAVTYLSAALKNATPKDRDELTFNLGRSYFGDEKYAEAKSTYLRGAQATTDARMKATFLFHASRAAQLLGGNDNEAVSLMTAAIAVPGRFPATTAALTQRIRTRLNQSRLGEAAADLQQLRKLAPKERAVVEASLAYAIGMFARGNAATAVQTLNAVPPALLDAHDRAEFAYWRARAAESNDARAALGTYLSVLRAPVPTHFAYFAHERVEAQAFAAKIAQELRTRDDQVAKLLAAKNLELARRVQTDRVLLTGGIGRARELEKLAAIYRQLPAYRAVLELAPQALPKFPLDASSSRAQLLMAMGLYDEAADEIPKLYPLRPAKSALTQSIALNRGGASKQSIYAVEVLMNGIPSDFVPDLLPRALRELLYPRYFLDFIAADAKKYGADPTLVLAIMREESRFNPRAKSEAAARGLLQFIITTARDIGRDVGLVDVDPQDLYDPRVIIRLGARYVAELSQTFEGNRHRAAAAYNAGPKQVALWSRLQPAPGDDFFLSSINFDETKHYVRKVMNSYARYGEIYGKGGAVGGMRVEP